MSKKNTEISARVAEMIEILGETPNSFSKRLGYSRAQTLYDILSGKSAPSYDFFHKFAISEFSVIVSLRWLLTGMGEAKEVTCPDNIDNINKAEQTEPSSFLIEKIAEQAEEIGRLKARIEELERRRGDNVGHAQSSDIANVG